ncbi:ankyrin repeat-containing domain protein, partial [Dipodascopsis uninucleata]
RSPSSRLRCAIVRNDVAIVKRLLKRFPELLENADDRNGWTSLHYAAYHGHFEICVHLASLGHDANEISSDRDGYTPLHLGAMRNWERTVHFLAQKFPETIDFKTATGKTAELTALVLAAREGHDATVNVLLDFGADVDGADKFGNRAIHYASAYGHRKVLRTLVERGADYKRRNTLGWTAQQYSFSSSTWSYLNIITLESDKR